MVGIICGILASLTAVNFVFIIKIDKHIAELGGKSLFYERKGGDENK